MNNKDQQQIRLFIIAVIVAGIIGFIAAISGSIGVATAKIIAICLSFIFF